MGKNKRTRDGGDEIANSHFSPSTVFVSNLPYSFNNPQLEEAFGDVGPIRRCFMVTQKGSTEHRGFGFVQFAVTEDANRAIEVKNGSSIGGRKIVVKLATQRAPREQRRPNTTQGKLDDDTLKSNKDDDNDDGVIELEKAAPEPEDRVAVASKKKLDKKLEVEKAVTLDVEPEVEKTDTKLEKKAASKKKSDKHEEVGKAAKDPEVEKVAHKPEKKVSSKKKLDKNEEVETAVTPKDPEVEKVAQKLEKKVVASDKKVEARKVATLHKNLEDKSGCSETQRVARTVIVGGLLNGKIAEDIHAIAKKIGTVCSIAYPLPKEELEKHGVMQEGCKMDASAILYTSVKSARAAVAALHQKDVKGVTIWARQLGGEGCKTQKWKLIIRNIPFKVKNNEIREMFSSAGFVWDIFVPQNPETRTPKGFAFVKFTSKSDAENAIQKFNGQKLQNRPIAVDWAVPKNVYTRGNDGNLASDNSEADESDGASESDYDDGDDSGDDIDRAADVSEVDFDEEADIAKKVLKNLMASASKDTRPSDDDPKKNQKPSAVEPVDKPNTIASESAKATEVSMPGKSEKVDPSHVKQTDETADLQGTVFISNIPFDVSNDEVKERFSAFGEVQSFFPVLHQVTKRPRGTGFLKFKTVDAATAAVSAANAASDLGISLKGRKLTVLKALDKKSAHDKEVQKAKKEDFDHRNTYLAKEGAIIEGTKAAEGVSASDMAKRQALERKRATKLQSPNFHISKTRIVIYNIPKSMKEHELKKLCIDAVTARATKQKPYIRQIKFMQDVKKGQLVVKNHSRGVAFVEFAEHQHALVALRVLNNNPETFGPDNRPIVEFAVDNVQKLKIMKAKQRDQNNTQERRNDTQQNNNPNPRNPRQNETEPRKRKSEGENRESDNAEVNNKEGKLGNRIGKRLKSNPAGENPHNPSPKGSFRENRSSQPYDKSRVEVQKSKLPADTDSRGGKRMGQDRKNTEKGEDGPNRRKRVKKNNDVLGRDHVDKLDMLIEKYRTRYTEKSSNPGEGPPQSSVQLRKWYKG